LAKQKKQVLIAAAVDGAAAGRSSLQIHSLASAEHTGELSDMVLQFHLLATKPKVFAAIKAAEERGRLCAAIPSAVVSTLLKVGSRHAAKLCDRYFPLFGWTRWDQYPPKQGWRVLVSTTLGDRMHYGFVVSEHEVRLDNGGRQRYNYWTRV
jgi:hypothetical protein